MERYYILVRYLCILNEDNSEDVYEEGSLFKEIRTLDLNTIGCIKVPEREKTIIINIKRSYLEPLKLHEFELLLAIPLPEKNRIQVWRNKEWLNEGLTLHVGSPVIIVNHNQLKDGTEGVIRYKGLLPSKYGMWFGVELAPQYAGEGSTDGMFRRQKFFHCPDDCGIFVSVFRIRNNEHIPLLRSRGYHVTTNEPEIEDVILESFPFKLQDRVVWISDNGEEAGTIKWIGRLPDSTDDNIIVGVHFDNPVGSGTGRYKGEQLFLTPRGHASLMPPLGLIKYSDFYGENPESLTERFESVTLREKETLASSLETSPPSLNRNNDPEIMSRNDPDIIASLRPLGPPLTPRGYNLLPSSEPTSHLPPYPNPLQFQFEIGQTVYTVLNEKRYGTIRYIGPHPKAKDRRIAGLEMEISDPSCYTDGELAGEKLFKCRPKSAFFVYLEKCNPDDR